MIFTIYDLAFSLIICIAIGCAIYRISIFLREQLKIHRFDLLDLPADSPESRVYICGPMTGLPEYNYPAFNECAAELRRIGFIVENPAENQAPVCGSWDGYMRMAIAQLVKCDQIVLLPGWDKSRGAKIEVDIAKNLQIPLYEWRAEHDWLNVREFALNRM